jgi:hypothetical protein
LKKQCACMMMMIKTFLLFLSLFVRSFNCLTLRVCENYLKKTRIKTTDS